jgi:uncharacterized protein (DUF433 family)
MLVSYIGIRYLSTALRYTSGTYINTAHLEKAGQLHLPTGDASYGDHPEKSDIRLKVGLIHVSQGPCSMRRKNMREVLPASRYPTDPQPSATYHWSISPWSGTMPWHHYITVGPAICDGQACISGTRIPVAVVLANLATGLTAEDLRQSYPGLLPEAVSAALAYAAELTNERVVRLPPAA